MRDNLFSIGLLTKAGKSNDAFLFGCKYLSPKFCNLCGGQPSTSGSQTRFTLDCFWTTLCSILA